MKLTNSHLIFIVLFFMSLVIIMVSGQPEMPNCKTTLIVTVDLASSIRSNETTSLDGFDISLDGDVVGTTRQDGSSAIDVSGATGRHTIGAYKQDDKGCYCGGASVNIKSCTQKSVSLIAQPCPCG